MKGSNIKKMLIANGVDLNNQQYIDNSKIYELTDIPDIQISREHLKNILLTKFDEITCEYILTCQFGDSHLVNPMKILNIFEIKK